MLLPLIQALHGTVKTEAFWQVAGETLSKHAHCNLFDQLLLCICQTWGKTVSYLQSFDFAWFFESYLINLKRWEGRNIPLTSLWVFVGIQFLFVLDWMVIKHLKHGTSAGNLISKADFGAQPQTRTVKMPFFRRILKWMAITKICSRTEESLLKSLGNLDFFLSISNCGVLTPIQIMYSPFKCQSADLRWRDHFQLQ